MLATRRTRTVFGSIMLTILLLLTGCGGNSESVDTLTSTTESATPVEPSAEPTPAPTSEPTDEVEPEEEPAEVTYEAVPFEYRSILRYAYVLDPQECEPFLSDITAENFCVHGDPAEEDDSDLEWAAWEAVFNEYGTHPELSEEQTEYYLEALAAGAFSAEGFKAFKQKRAKPSSTASSSRKSGSTSVTASPSPRSGRVSPSPSPSTNRRIGSGTPRSSCTPRPGKPCPR